MKSKGWRTRHLKQPSEQGFEKDLQDKANEMMSKRLPFTLISTPTTLSWEAVTAVVVITIIIFISCFYRTKEEGRKMIILSNQAVAITAITTISCPDSLHESWREWLNRKETSLSLIPPPILTLHHNRSSSWSSLESCDEDDDAMKSSKEIVCVRNIVLLKEVFLGRQHWETMKKSRLLLLSTYVDRMNSSSNPWLGFRFPSFFFNLKYFSW